VRKLGVQHRLTRGAPQANKVRRKEAQKAIGALAKVSREGAKKRPAEAPQTAAVLHRLGNYRAC